MKVLVCGGRKYQQVLRLQRVLDDLHLAHKITCVVHGASRGADTLAENWARSRQIKYIGIPAEWDRVKLGAGPLRNTRMLEEENPDAVIAFPGGTGTADMTRQAHERGFVNQVRDDEIVFMLRA